MAQWFKNGFPDLLCLQMSPPRVFIILMDFRKLLGLGSSCLH